MAFASEEENKKITAVAPFHVALHKIVLVYGGDARCAGIVLKAT
jgi:hypothetical protein